MQDYIVSTIFKSNDQLSRSIDKLSNRVGLFGSRADRAFDMASKSALGFKGLVGGMLTSSAIQSGIGLATRGIGSMVDEVIDLDSALTGAASKFGFQKGTEQWKKMEAAARKTGETSIYNATEAAQALNEMGGAGKDLAESMALLPKLTTFAVAGDFDKMGEAMEMTASIIASLGIQSKTADEYADNFQRVGDVMAKADIIGMTSVQELGQSLVNVSPAIRGGLDDITSLSAMLNTMAASGLRGADAGTNLAFAFRRLTQKIPKATRELNKYKISVSDKDTGKMRSMIDIVEQLQKSFDKFKLKDIKKQEVLTNIFGAAGSKAIMPLINNIDLTRKSLEQLKTSAGASMELAEIKGQSFENRIKGIQSRLTELGLKVFDVFESDIYSAFDHVEQWLKDFDGDKFKQWVSDTYAEVRPLGEGLIDLAKKGGAIVEWFKENDVSLMDIVKVFAAWKVATLGLNVALTATKTSLGGVLATKGLPMFLKGIAALGIGGAAAIGVGAGGAAVIGNKLLDEQEKSHDRLAEMKRLEKSKRIARSDTILTGDIYNKSLDKSGGNKDIAKYEVNAARMQGISVPEWARRDMFAQSAQQVVVDPGTLRVDFTNIPEATKVSHQPGKGNAPRVKANLGSQRRRKRSLDYYLH